MTSPISFNSMSFFYVNEDAPEKSEDLTGEDINLLFEDFTLDLSPGVTSIIGENGIGKSTLLLLAGARLFPVRGQVELFGTPTQIFRSAYADLSLEEARNKLVSFVYQNMEFDTPMTLGKVLEQVASNGILDERFSVSTANKLLIEIHKTFELVDYLTRPMDNLAKGVMQRAVMAMALLYGSKMILMDEPVFAMEEPRKEQVMEFVHSYSREYDTPIVFTAHQIHLCETYSDSLLILRKLAPEGELPYFFGPTKEICKKEIIEQAYRVPYETLHQKEFLYREMLVKKFGN